MKGWKGLDAAADVLGRVPERWCSASERIIPGRPELPTPGEIEAGFDVVEAGLRALGPQDEDEPRRDSNSDADLACWIGFVRHFQDLRTVSAASVRSYLATMSEPPPYPRARRVVTWCGLMRGWIRAKFGALALTIVRETPPFYRDDPKGLREVAFERVQRVALMLPDLQQAPLLGMIAERVEMRVEPLVTRLYHHPDAGPRMRAAPSALFESWVVERIEANVPDHHEDPDW